MKNNHEKLMSLALEQAIKAKDIGEVPVGAVIADKDGTVISLAHNLVEKSQDCTQHAEIIAIKEASNKTKNWRLEHCSLYVTLEPCTMCIGAILQSRISKLYFGAYEPKTGAVGSIYNLSNNPNLTHQIEVYPELLKNDCTNILKDFFQNIRSTK